MPFDHRPERGGGGERNALGGPLDDCSHHPKTGYFRDGCCRTMPGDHGVHTVCAVMTEDFLKFTQARGNDLSTPRPEYDFPGLKPGDKWCLCASRWLEAYEMGQAPGVVLAACHAKTLEIVPLDALTAYAVDAN